MTTYPLKNINLAVPDFRTLHDVKATEMGTSFVRFKAEVDFDGRELTRYYLENHDLDKMLEVRMFTVP